MYGIRFLADQVSQDGNVLYQKYAILMSYFQDIISESTWLTFGWKLQTYLKNPFAAQDKHRGGYDADLSRKITDATNLSVERNRFK